ncbi:MAG: alpha/beta hydrolase [Abditibacteriota bacterium]|nr:alpha/beta hydrolase [Abditibacteriota bacterium]
MRILLLVLVMVLAAGICQAQDKKYIEEKGIVFDRQDDVDLIMDMKTLDDGRKNKPCCVAIHGGGWAGGGIEDSNWLGAPLLDMGYTVFGITYRLAPKHPFPAQIEDCKSAVRHIRANAKKYNIDPRRIVSYGGSAGGHLASLLGVLPDGVFEGKGPNQKYSSRVNLVISNVGPEDMEFFLPLTGRVALRDDGFHWLFDGTKEGWDYWVPRSSPINYVTRDSAPHLLLYGGSDDLVYAAQGELFHNKMKAAGAKSEIYICPGSWHILPGDFLMAHIPAFLERHFGKQ